MAEEPQLYTLTEVAKRTGISLPTLQRYKKRHQARIPSVGKGRTQRYPEEALEVFEAIKQENLKKRGRPKKKASAKKAKGKKTARKKRATRAKTAGRKASGKKATAKKAKRKKTARKASAKRAGGSARKASKSDGNLLTLTEIGRRTGLSYPTLLRYVKLHLNRIPHVGTGRKRRYPEAAVETFQEIRASSKRGRRKKKPGRRAAAAPAGSGIASRLRRIETEQRRLGRQLQAVLSQLKKPIQVSVKR